MVLRTFNFWYVVTPVTMVIAIVLALVSITEGKTKAKKRVSDRFWQRGMVCYCIIIWALLSKMFITESLLGMIEALGADGYDVASRAKGAFRTIAALWAVVVYFAAFFARDWYIKYVNYACAHGRSKADRTRRKRERKKQQEHKREMEKRRKLAASGKLYLVDFDNSGASVRPIASEVAKTPPTPSQDTEEDNTIEQQVEEEFGKYRIERRTDLDSVYTDKEGNKYNITMYLPEGANEYFVAINLECQEQMPIFLGWENAEDNLRRYLTEELEEPDCSEHAAV